MTWDDADMDGLGLTKWGVDVMQTVVNIPPPAARGFRMYLEPWEEHDLYKNDPVCEV